jgi:crotonobetainyl-CoA:carnitine CoA-transferase CaiB-like acyl-CoA transferase
MSISDYIADILMRNQAIEALLGGESNVNIAKKHREGLKIRKKWARCDPSAAADGSFIFSLILGAKYLKRFCSKILNFFLLSYQKQRSEEAKGDKEYARGSGIKKTSSLSRWL